MNNIETMKLALEALEWINRVNAMDYEYKQKARETLNAIYEMLAEQAEQAQPVARKKHEPTIDLDKYAGTYGGYTSPPQRQPLTDEQFRKIKASLSRQEGWDGDGWDLALKEAIEAAHGIKENT